jgi:hypothetical protein
MHMGYLCIHLYPHSHGVDLPCNQFGTCIWGDHLECTLRWYHTEIFHRDLQQNFTLVYKSFRLIHKYIYISCSLLVCTQAKKRNYWEILAETIVKTATWLIINFIKRGTILYHSHLLKIQNTIITEIQMFLYLWNNSDSKSHWEEIHITGI